MRCILQVIPLSKDGTILDVNHLLTFCSASSVRGIRGNHVRKQSRRRLRRWSCYNKYVHLPHGFGTNYDHLAFAVNTANGDITSLKFNSIQLQDSSKFTQLSSGLGSATVTSSVANNIAVITIETSTIVCVFCSY